MFRHNCTVIQLVLAGQALKLKLIVLYLVFLLNTYKHARITRSASIQPKS
jgi:hypothetical protein